MSEVIAGIAIFPDTSDEYNISISLISCAQRSVIHNQSSSSPVNIASLTETVRTMIFSAFTEPTTVTSLFTSFPPAFPYDRYYEVFNALESAKLVSEFDYPALPLNHGEAYAMRLPKRPRQATILLTLDYSSTNHLYAGRVSSKGSGGRRVNTITSEVCIALTNENNIQHVVEKMLTAPQELNNAPDHVLLIRPPGTTDKEVTTAHICGLIAGIYPDVPVTMATFSDIAQAAVCFAYAKFLLINGRALAKYFIIIPVSVATASGAIVPVVRSFRTLPIEIFITLTNSVDYQKSATVRVLLGNRPQAKDNFPGAIVTLDGLTPLPRGEARIRVTLKVISWDGWRAAAQISVEQKDGPKKTFLIPRFFADLPKNYERYDIRMKREQNVAWEEESEVVVGKLPEYEC